MRKKYKKMDLSSMVPLLLFLMLGVCMITVLLLGARTYRSQVRRDREEYGQRTVIRYLTTRIRQSDVNGMWDIGNFESMELSEEGDTLFFFEQIGEELFCTRIYCYNGYLYELFSSYDDKSFSREDGERLISVDKLGFLKKDNGIYANVEWADSSSKQLYLFQRSTQGEQ